MDDFKRQIEERAETLARSYLASPEAFKQTAKTLGVTDPELIPTIEDVKALMETPSGKMAFKMAFSKSVNVTRVLVLIDVIAEQQAAIETLQAEGRARDREIGEIREKYDELRTER